MGLKPKMPKTPPPPAPPPSATGADVAQETEYEKRKALAKGGRTSTILTQAINPAQQGGKTLLGQ